MLELVVIPGTLLLMFKLFAFLFVPTEAPKRTHRMFYVTMLVCFIPYYCFMAWRLFRS